MSKQGMLVLNVLLLAVAFWLGTLFATSNGSGADPIVAVVENGDQSRSTSPEYMQAETNAKLDTKCVPNTAAQAKDISISSANQQTLDGLQQELKQLSDTLNKQEAALNRQNNRYNRAVAKLREAGIDIPEGISLEEASELLPEPFNEVIANAGPMMTDRFKELQTQEQDYDWAIRMQQQVQDYFVTHEMGHLVQLNSVMCKTNICEVRGFESQRGIWGVIIKSMEAQDWWTPFSSNTVSGDNSEQGSYFYVLAQFSRSTGTLQND